MDRLEIGYRFRLADGQALEFRLQIEPHTMELVDTVSEPVPDWCALEFHQCPNCPLSKTKHPHCPAAVRLAPIVERCRGVRTYADARMEVETAERTVVAIRPLQKGLSSLVGLVMAASGCPRTAYLKPMARFHLPLASEEETLYRAASMFLLAQYLRHKRGDASDAELEGLAEIYRNLQTVNTAMTERLRAAAGADAAGDAIMSLDLLSHILPFDIKTSLKRLRPLFAAYMTS